MENRRAELALPSAKAARTCSLYGVHPGVAIVQSYFRKKDRIMHRIEITAAEQIDGEVKKWLKTAYDLDQ